MAKLYYICSECKKKFDLRYIIFKPENIKCPACGSLKVKEDVQSQACGCGGNDRGNTRFT